MIASKMIVAATACLFVAAGFAGCFGVKDETDEDPGVPTPPAEAGRHLDVDVTAIRCPEGYDNARADNICLAYNGQIPGPTWVFQAGESVTITLHHRVADTLEALGEDAQGGAYLAKARYSLHRHGISQDACSDGVAQPAGTSVCDSTVGPGENVTYTFGTLFPGFWHYHDHSHTFTASSAQGPILGREAVERGLWGSLIVLPTGEATDRVFDLHLTDAGANGGLGLEALAQPGERFDINVVGLGSYHRFYDVRFEDPDGAIVGEVMVGPGVSRGITVHDARPGTYTWTAGGKTVFVPTGHVAPLPWTPDSFAGTITVAEGEPDDEASPAPGRGPSHDLADALPTSPADADHVFVIPFNYEASTALVRGGQTMGLPLLEANVGDVLEFRVESSDWYPHVFHLHGHSWVDPDTGEFIDAVPLVPGHKTSHNFTVVAGLEAGHAGDWLYHCHVNFDKAMWGVLRVHP